MMVITWIIFKHVNCENFEMFHVYEIINTPTHGPLQSRTTMPELTDKYLEIENTADPECMDHPNFFLAVQVAHG